MTAFTGDPLLRRQIPQSTQTYKQRSGQPAAQTGMSIVAVTMQAAIITTDIRIR